MIKRTKAVRRAHNIWPIAACTISSEAMVSEIKDKSGKVSCQNEAW